MPTIAKQPEPTPERAALLKLMAREDAIPANASRYTIDQRAKVYVRTSDYDDEYAEYDSLEEAREALAGEYDNVADEACIIIGYKVDARRKGVKFDFIDDD